MRLIIVGINGAMGHFVVEAAKAQSIDIVAGVDVNLTSNPNCPVFADFENVPSADVIIDFSYHGAVKAILDYAVSTNTPVVLNTTGYTEDELDLINEASKHIAIFRSGNMSLGINVLIKLIKAGLQVLGDKADVEIIEQHHHRKIDAPSGTALMLADAVKSVEKDAQFVYGRQGNVGRRPKNEVGIHAVRGGSIVGKHEVIFALNNEVITLKHEAESRAVFAEGAVTAAMYLCDKPAGHYNMDDLMA